MAKAEITNRCAICADPKWCHHPAKPMILSGMVHGRWTKVPVTLKAVCTLCLFGSEHHEFKEGKA